MGVINYFPGNKFLYNDQEVVILRVEDVDQVLIETIKNNKLHTVDISELKPVNSVKLSKTDLIVKSKKELGISKMRFEIIKPILDNPSNFELIKNVAEENNVHVTTLYRWINKFKEGGTLSSLTNKKRNDGVFKSRLNDELESIIQNSIEKHYLNKDRKSINRVVFSVQLECKKKGIESPHVNTIKNRIKKIKPKETIEKRESKKIARHIYGAKLGSLEADFPLEIVQIDHTILDIILVDPVNRLPFKRPYITLAIDLFSRMVVGFYLSFDPPGLIGTGQCIANSILPKDKLLNKYNLTSKWPCWGVMKCIHLDNAKEFRSDILKKACEEYRIEINYRPVATPHWGGHIERLLGNFSKQIHDLPGTTFSNIQIRKKYDSEKMSTMTIDELEKWLLIYITEVYHEQMHSGIGMSPLQKYKSGYSFEEANVPGFINSRYDDESRVQIDFMPFIQRSIQNYGVVINNITYYDEILNEFIKARNGKKVEKFQFRIDPRDISVIYFYHPIYREYYEIPYRNISNEPMSIWEYNHIVNELKRSNVQINEETIFEGKRKMIEIENKAIEEKKRLHRSSRKSDNRKSIETSKNDLKTDTIDTDNSEFNNLDSIEPFEDISIF